MPSSSPSATVSQYNLSGSEYLWTDTGSYTSVTSRILVVTDFENNVVVNTGNIAPLLTYILTVPSDGWLKFTATIIDSNGTWVSTVYWVAAGYYIAAYLNQYAVNNCGCQTNNCNLDIAERFYIAALRFNLQGQSGAVPAQACIMAANLFVNQSPVVQFA